MRLHVVTDPDRLYCGHMTVYPNGRKERLHGHNFRIDLAIDLADGSFAAMIDLGALPQGRPEQIGGARCGHQRPHAVRRPGR